MNSEPAIVGDIAVCVLNKELHTAPTILENQSTIGAYIPACPIVIARHPHSSFDLPATFFGRLAVTNPEQQIVDLDIVRNLDGLRSLVEKQSAVSRMSIFQFVLIFGAA